MPVAITASYCFQPIADLTDLQERLAAFGKEKEMKGLVLIATEGLNGTVSGSAEAISDWKNFLTEKFPDIEFKDSESEKQVFRRWSVKIKPEIVGLHQEGILPKGKHKHLSPEEWQQVLDTEDVVIVDARNTYEAAVGKFRNAIIPDITAFHEFPEFVKKADLPKAKKVLMYCTGGIRCEKALLEMEKQGYDNVYQLDGGILAYLEKFPQKDFEGECFVFDHRVAVDQDLQPSKIYGLCPHCGYAGSVTITCTCGKEQKICTDCLPLDSRKTCSKRCANIQKKMFARASERT